MTTYYGNQVAYGSGGWWRAVLDVWDDGGNTGTATNVHYQYSVQFGASVSDSTNTYTWTDPWGSGNANNTSISYGSGGGTRVLSGPHTQAAGIQYGGGNSIHFSVSANGYAISGSGPASNISIDYPLPARLASPPDPPIVAVDTITSTGAHVYVAVAGAENGATTDAINYRVHRVSDGAHMGDIQGGYAGVTYSNFARATAYDAYAQPHNAAGWGGFSAASRFTTAATVPDTPAAPSVSGVTAVAATITISAPSNNGGSAVTSYDVQYDDAADFSSPVTISDTGVGAHPVSGLSAATTYRARYRATNAVGDSAWSPVATFTTTSPAAPAAPTVSAPNASSVAVSWTLPNGYGASITDVDVSLYTASTGGSLVVTADKGPTDTTHTFTGLSGDTTYWAQVDVAFSTGGTKSSARTSVKTPTAATVNRQATGGYTRPGFLRVLAGSGSLGSLKATSSVQIPVTALRTYQVSGYLKVSGTVGHFTSLGLEVRYNGNPAATARATVAASTSWSRANTQFTPPVGTTYVTLAVYAGASIAAGEWVGVDGLMVSEGMDLLPYFDGATTDGAFNYGWTGTADASTSQRSPATGYEYVDPYAFVNILGDSTQVTISRAVLDASTMSVTNINPDIDPSVTTDILRRGRRIILATTSGTALYTGTIDDVRTAYVLDKERHTTKPVITIDAVDAAQALANAKATNGYATLDGIANLMQNNTTLVPFDINGHTSDVSTALPCIVADNQTLLDQIVLARDSSSGVAYVGADGVLHGADSPDTDPVLTLADSGLFDLSYSDIDVSFASSSCINSVQVVWNHYDTATGEITWPTFGPFVDQESIDVNGIYSKNFTVNAATYDQPTAAAYAASILAANGDPGRTVNSLKIPVLTADDIAAVGVVDLCTPVEVKYAGLVDQSHRVSTITHSISPGGWLTTYGFEPVGSVASPIQTSTPVAVPSDTTTFDNVTVEGSLTVAGKALLDLTYPVGSIYLSVVNTNPATLFGGTWSAWGTGRVPVAVDTGQTEFNTVEKTGGAKTHTLTAAESGLPAHNHTQNAHNHTQNAHGHGVSDPGHAHGHNSGTNGYSGGIAGGLFFTNNPPSHPGYSGFVLGATTGISIVAATPTNNATTATNNANAAANASAAHNNLQPYITCYMFKRTA